MPHGEFKYRCPRCGQIFVYKEYLMTHLKFSIHCVKSPVYEEQCNSNVSRPVRYKCLCYLPYIAFVIMVIFKILESYHLMFVSLSVILTRLSLQTKMFVSISLTMSPLQTMMHSSTFLSSLSEGGESSYSPTYRSGPPGLRPGSYSNTYPRQRMYSKLPPGLRIPPHS